VENKLWINKGGIIAIDPNSNLGVIEYLIALLGLIISSIGLGKKD